MRADLSLPHSGSLFTHISDVHPTFLLFSAEYDPLLLIPMFVLDFLCIHPFDDGNGRLSRLLTLLLLYRAGYMIGMYISIEKLIEQTKMNYYEALQESSLGWDEGENDYLPFVRYMLGVVVAAYRDFSSHIQLLAVNRMSKPRTEISYPHLRWISGHIPVLKSL